MTIARPMWTWFSKLIDSSPPRPFRVTRRRGWGTAAELLESRVLLSATIANNTVEPGAINGSYEILAAGDFDGAGELDLFFNDPRSGANRFVLNGASGTQLETNLVPPSAINGNDFPQLVVGNFDGTGTDDLFFWNPRSGKNRLVSVDDGNFVFRTNIVDPTSINGNDFTEVVVGQFSPDAATDLFFWNPRSGRNRLIQFERNTVAGNFATGRIQTNIVQTGAINGNDFQRIVAGSFGSDIVDDLYFWNPRSGRNRYITVGFNSTTDNTFQTDLQTNVLPATSINGNDFTEIIVADFDQNTQDDFFFWNPVTGRNRTAYLSGDDPQVQVENSNIAPGAINGNAYRRLTAVGTDVFFWSPGNGQNRSAAGLIDPVNVDPVTITEFTPGNSEELVNVARTVRVSFSRSIDPNSVTTDSIRVMARGDDLPGRINVGSTGDFLQFIPDSPLPESTEISVIVNGDQLRDPQGNPIDADGNGLAGGLRRVEFSTLPLSFIPGTAVSGRILSSNQRGPNGEDIPIVGATIRLESRPDIFAVTDANGEFTLASPDGLPAPEVFVVIDGSTATNTPNGFMYPTLGKPFSTVAGQSIQMSMNGQPMDIFLPLMNRTDIFQLSETEITQVGFGDGGLQTLAELFPDVDPEVWQRTRVSFMPGSAQNDAGTAATRAAIVPVDPERLPGGLPNFLDPRLVISIQAGDENGLNGAGGATNFETPAAISFPNLDGLAPGDQALIFSYDHEAGRWIVSGTGTVSDDGLMIGSDGGVIRAPGWHAAQPGTPAEPELTMDEEPVVEPPTEFQIITVSDRAAFVGDGTMNIRVTIDVPPPEVEPNSNAEPAETVTFTLNVDNAVFPAFPFATNTLTGTNARVTQIDGRSFGPFEFSTVLLGRVELVDFPVGRHEILIEGVGVPEVPQFEEVTFKIEKDGAIEDSFTTTLVADRRPIQDFRGLLFRDGLNQPLPISSNEDLANAFRPTLFLDPGEPFQPNAVDQLIENVINGGDLRLPQTVSASERLTRQDIAQLADANAELDLIGNGPANYRALRRGNVTPTVYSAVTPDLANGRIAITYWFHFEYSSWFEEGGFNNHEGDWESVTIFLQQNAATEFQPVAIAYAQHEQHAVPASLPNLRGGVLVTYPQTSLGPNVFFGRGGHASYPQSGTSPWFALEIRSGNSTLIEGNLFDEDHRIGGEFFGHEDYLIDFLPAAPLSESSAQDGWLMYPGRWGQIDLPDNNFFGAGGTGPTGPLYRPDDRWYDPWAFADGLNNENGIELNSLPSNSTSTLDTLEDAVSSLKSTAVAAVATSVGNLELVGLPDNFGGVPIGLRQNVPITLRNTSSTAINITQLQIDASADFQLDLANVVSTGNPFVIQPGENMTVGLAFSPSAIGLLGGKLTIQADGSARVISLVGTGISDSGSTLPKLGNDFVVLVTPNNDVAAVQRLLSNRAGHFTAQLRSDEFVQYQIFDPETGLIGITSLTSSPSGRPTRLATPTFAASTAPDTDGDGLPDDIEFTIGTLLDNPDSDNDGIPDGAELAEGLNPLDGIVTTTGVVATLDLGTETNALTVAENVVYVVHGEQLSVIDSLRFDQPILQGRLDLFATGIDVAVDLQSQTAVVPTGETVELIDVSDLTRPVRTQSLPVAAEYVEVVDGFAYVASERVLTTIDLLNGVILSQLVLPGTGEVVDLTRSGNQLYAIIDRSFTLVSIDISRREQPEVVGQLQVPNDQSDIGLFAANDVLWIANGRLRTVDISDPANMSLIAESNNFLGVGQLALNGSGLAVVLRNFDSIIEIYDTSNPADLDRFITQFNLIGNTRGVANDVAISRGIAFVAIGQRLDIVNYQPSDASGQPPAVAIRTRAADTDPAPGLQLLEGTRVAIVADVLDDVQVRQVELLANGQVVGSNVAFPFDLSTMTPLLADGVGSLDLQVRATDTGGNVGLSNVITIDVVPDTTRPEIESISPFSKFNGFFGKTIEFDIEVAGDNTQVGPPALVTVDDNVELTDFPGLFGSATINIANLFFDISTTRIEADFSQAGTGFFPAANFNGYIVRDVNDVLPDILNVTIDPTMNSLGLMPDDVTFDANTIRVNVENLPFNPNSTFAIDVEFADDPASTPEIPSGPQLFGVRFSEALDENTVNAQTFRIVGSGTDQQFGTADDFQAGMEVGLRSNNELVQIAVDLVPGEYRLVINSSAVTDQSGNSLGDATFERAFSVVAPPIASFQDVVNVGTLSRDQIDDQIRAISHRLPGPTFGTLDTAFSEIARLLLGICTVCGPRWGLTVR